MLIHLKLLPASSSGPMVDLLPAGVISHGLYGGSTFVQNLPTGHVKNSENSSFFVRLCCGMVAFVDHLSGWIIFDHNNLKGFDEFQGD